MMRCLKLVRQRVAAWRNQRLWRPQERLKHPGDVKGGKTIPTSNYSFTGSRYRSSGKARSLRADGPVAGRVTDHLQTRRHADWADNLGNTVAERLRALPQEQRFPIPAAIMTLF
ncbi:hypothetical protein GDO78_011017 [Eleutherodactylus coqui]|uniref:Uncharacterized protein n=1 Tax=Eleutherodactylus coqui TaxID=57060 RepID=A0A8J6F7E9_ELECQ|nr:hypothetical protein GDO78_011017 [Eleutherodactylus coqui]